MSDFSGDPALASAGCATYQHDERPPSAEVIDQGKVAASCVGSFGQAQIAVGQEAEFARADLRDVALYHVTGDRRRDGCRHLVRKPARLQNSAMLLSGELRRVTRRISDQHGAGRARRLLIALDDRGAVVGHVLQHGSAKLVRRDLGSVAQLLSHGGCERIGLVEREPHLLQRARQDTPQERNLR